MKIKRERNGLISESKYIKYALKNIKEYIFKFKKTQIRNMFHRNNLGTGVIFM